jgi:predicted acylesterase/phospholipase RssA
MARIGATTSFTDFGRWTPSWLGLATNQRLEKFLARFTPVKTFEEMKTPLAIAATDINAGITVYYSRGPVGPAACTDFRLSESRSKLNR